MLGDWPAHKLCFKKKAEMAEGTAMIDDALKVLRNLHRLIITASLVTLIFSLSLKYPHKTEAYRDLINKFLRVDFPKYDRFVDASATHAASALLEARSSAILRGLEASNHLAFGLGEISAALEKPALIGRFKVSDTKLDTPSEFTLRQLDLLSELYPLGRDVHIAIPEVSNLIAQAGSFLDAESRTGMKVQNVSVQPSDYYTSGTMPGDGEIIKMILAFELMPSGGPPIPVFNGAFDAKIMVLTNTSFCSWVSGQPELSGIAVASSNAVKWLPALGDLPWESADRSLANLLASIKDELKKSNPENKSVSLLGAEIPGNLLVYATPLVLLALSYYFLFHLAHLLRYVHQNRGMFEQFAWLPLSLERGWALEVLFSLGALPILSLTVLAGQLARFGLLDWHEGVFIAAGVLPIIYLCQRSITEIRILRHSIGRAPP